jgi:serine phosphatase RsbU (regulator of sigma subunit)
LPLGLDEHSSIPVTSALIEPGSRVHLYTDGITEHRNSDGEFLGLNGYAEILQETFVADSNPASQCQDSADRVMNLNSKLTPEDDVTMLILSSTAS